MLSKAYNRKEHLLMLVTLNCFGIKSVCGIDTVGHCGEVNEVHVSLRLPPRLRRLRVGL